MSIELAVLIIHGMGSQDSDFADEMTDELSDRVSRLNKDPAKIAWQPIHWADITEPKQKEYFKKAKRTNDLDFASLRKFMLSAFGDASGYQKVDSSHNTTYERIHGLVGDSIRDVYQTKLGSIPKPMIVLAHSLGGHIMSNYIWDMQHSTNPGLSDFERMNYLSGIVTFGCNIPLFTFAFDTVVPIEFPPAALPAQFKSKAKWFNYFDPDDVLGYPLKPINSAYRQVVNKDVAINVGGILSSWNPMSHSKYWTDNDFTVPVSKYIAKFL